MISSSLILWMLFVHWIADFVLQDDETAINKSHDWGALLYHSALYSFFMIALGIGAVSEFSSWRPSLLFLINFPAHFIIDAITSRINARLYAGGHRHWFFTMIGFDQVLHYAVLLLTL